MIKLSNLKLNNLAPVLEKMGIGLRIFLLEDDDTVKRLPLAKYERMLRGYPDDLLPKYAGKRIRCAEVAVEFSQRKPTQIARIIYLILPFDSEGRINLAEKQRETGLAKEAETPPFTKEELAGPVIDARHHFAKKRYSNEYRWTPSKKIEVTILNAIFGQG